MTTTFEEAKFCPKCGKSGLVTKVTPGPKGSKVHVVTCMNEACKWYQTGWLVQTMRDGSVPTRPKGVKEFPDDLPWS